MRRADREILDHAEILSVIRACRIMHLGLCDEGQPYVLPLHFGLIEREGRLRLYFHSAASGRKHAVIRMNNLCAVTFTLDTQVTRAPQPCDWSAEFASVMAEGSVRLVTDEAEKREGMDALMRHYGFEGEPSYSPQVYERTDIFCVETDKISGKRKGGKQ